MIVDCLQKDPSKRWVCVICTLIAIMKLITLMGFAIYLPQLHVGCHLNYIYVKMFG
jgi:hypothetical protein